MELTLVNLDENGLRDESFAKIVDAVTEASSHLRCLNYNNNQLGPKSVEALDRLF